MANIDSLTEKVQTEQENLQGKLDEEQAALEDSREIIEETIENLDLAERDAIEEKSEEYQS